MDTSRKNCVLSMDFRQECIVKPPEMYRKPEMYRRTYKTAVISCPIAMLFPQDIRRRCFSTYV